MITINELVKKKQESNVMRNECRFSLAIFHDRFRVLFIFARRRQCEGRSALLFLFLSLPSSFLASASVQFDRHQLTVRAESQLGLLVTAEDVVAQSRQDHPCHVPTVN